MATEKRLGDLNALMDSHFWESLTDDFDKARAKIIIMSAPTVEAVEVVHGHWIEKPFLFGTTRYCSVCGNNYGMPHGIFNYCPNCGAKMDGGNEDG